jgi:hypothetical protein
MTRSLFRLNRMIGSDRTLDPTLVPIITNNSRTPPIHRPTPKSDVASRT